MPSFKRFKNCRKSAAVQEKSQSDFRNPADPLLGIFQKDARKICSSESVKDSRAYSYEHASIHFRWFKNVKKNKRYER